MPVSTTPHFLEMLRKSGLLGEEAMRSVEAGPAEAPAALADRLIRQGLLTRFQTKQLLAGRHKGFFLGKYKIMEVIGQGGMGRVFLAEQTGMKRKVALKVLAAKVAEDELSLQRFYREARAAAALDHPNIVGVLDIRQEGPAHVLVMEYVDGEDLQQRLDRGRPLPPDEAVACVIQAALGLAHAHERGIVHRDIKPANLILSRTGALKILDMGLARSLTKDEDRLTERMDDHSVLGTPDFIAPEQATQQALDGRADIYSLGATFFTLLTGRPPFTGSATQKLLAHQLKDVPPLSSVRPGLPAALDAVIARMMAKDADDRFQTGAEVIAVLSAPLGEPPASTSIQKAEAAPLPGLTPGARPAVTGAEETRPIRAERTGRIDPAPPAPAPDLRKPLWRAGPWPWVGTGLAAALLAAGLAWALTRRPNRPAAEERPAPPTEPPSTRVDAPTPPAPPPPPPAPEPIVLNGHQATVEQVLFTPDGSKVVSASTDRTVIVWNARTGAPVQTIDTREKVMACAVTPDGKQVVTGGDGGTVRVWNLDTGTEAFRFETEEGSRQVRSVVLSRDGRRAVTAAQKEVVLWDFATGKPIRRIEERARLWTAALSPDGKLIASGGGTNPAAGQAGDYRIRLWNARTGAHVRDLTGHTYDVRRVVFSPDGKQLLSAGFDSTLRLWDVRTGALKTTITAPDGFAKAVLFLPGLRRILASGGNDMRPAPRGAPRPADDTIRAWDLATGKELLCLRGHTSGVLTLALSPGGKLLASAGHDKTVRLWAFSLAPR